MPGLASLVAAALSATLSGTPGPAAWDGQARQLLAPGDHTRALTWSWGRAWFRGPGEDQARTGLGFVGFYPQLGWFQTSRLELYGEATLHLYYEPHGAVFGGLVGIAGRYHFYDDRGWTPYVTLGGGLGWTSLDIVELDRVFNFQTIVGGGVRQVTRRGPGWMLEFRNHHVSNAGTRGGNIGINAATFVAGMHWVVR